MFFDVDKKFSTNTALRDGQNGSCTYKELAERADALNLKGKQGLVFNLCENHISSVVAYLAVLQNVETKQLILSSKLNKDFLKNLIEEYSPNYLYLPIENDYELTGYKVVSQANSFQLLESISHFEHHFNKELAVLLPTSGSTGSPKLVKLSYKNIESNAQSIAEYLEINEDDRPITTLPMNYAFGLSIINSHLMKGATIIINRFAVTEKEFWRYIQESRATSLSGVPFTFEMLKKLKFGRMDFPHLRYLAQAGGKLRADLVGEFGDLCLERGWRFYVMYGQTEATARMSYFLWEKDSNKAESIGGPIPGGEFLIYSEAGNLVEEFNVVGELVFKGDNVSLGYAFSPSDLSIGDERNGVLYTGDLVKRNKDGCYQIVGRKSRFIKICGSRYSLDEIESIIGGNEFSAVCVGEDDSLVIFITDFSKNEAVKQVVKRRLGIHPRYMKIKEIDKVPRNEYGKVNYLLLKEYASE